MQDKIVKCVKCGKEENWAGMFAVDYSDDKKGSICYPCSYPKTDFDKVFPKEVKFTPVIENNWFQRLELWQQLLLHFAVGLALGMAIMW